LTVDRFGTRAAPPALRETRRGEPPGQRHRQPVVDRRRRQISTVTDIANGIVFPASDDAGFMTGAGLVVDGGWTAQ
jgi:NAD(P)-dependent dehydrogenase (short-subunit alcohol dehydrogenase family)